MNWKKDKYLCRKFVEFDKKYFGGRLCEKGARVGWREPFTKGRAGEFYAPKRKDGTCIILISPKARKWGAQKYALSTLLHEMCHMSLWAQDRSCGSHGTLFQNEMKRLANAGAFREIW